jgi:hypothetical protein
MRNRTMLAVVLATGLALVSAQAQKMKTEIPSGITTPDSVETRLGTLKFTDGYPDDATTQKVYDNLDFMNGVNAFLNAMPGASVEAIKVGFASQGANNNQAAPKAAPAIDFMKPITHDEEKTSLQVFSILNFILQFCPTNPSETELMSRFAKINIGAGKTFDPSKLSPEMKTAVEQGIADAWAEFAGGVKLLDQGKLTSGDLFGTREFMKNNYLNRMLATIGIWGNSKQEAVYPIYRVDADGKALNGANRYTLRFAPGQLPPVNAFWSLTMYELPASLLVANPINRYLINSPMLPQLKKDPDGGLTLLIQNESPGKDKEANWLPAPKGPFAMYMRLYWPKEEATEGKWTAPPLQQVK